MCAPSAPGHPASHGGCLGRSDWRFPLRFSGSPRCSTWHECCSAARSMSSTTTKEQSGIRPIPGPRDEMPAARAARRRDAEFAGLDDLSEEIELVDVEVDPLCALLGDEPAL